MGFLSSTCNYTGVTGIMYLDITSLIFHIKCLLVAQFTEDY